MALAAATQLAWVHQTRYPLRPADAPAQSLYVPQGASAASIGKQLYDLGLVRHPAVFRILCWQRGASAHLRAGEYSIDGPTSLEDLLEMLMKGEVVRHEVTFPEGKALEDMSAIVAGHGLDPMVFLKAARDPAPIHDLDPQAKDLEGYLFPDTYDVAWTPEASGALVARMTQRFREVMRPELAGLPERGMTLREVVTLASVVELETARADERPRVAAVFLNRIKKGMPLQTDPTVIFALRRAGTWDGNIRKKDLDVDSPYNTYRHPGLPPGPIASPGRESLLAVLHPAPVRDLYFVSRNDGSHEFSETLADHERAVDRYQRVRTPRKGS